jgi:hypothetical protein
MRVPFCLEIQHHFASNFTRVGVPVAPPFYRPLNVVLYECSADSNYGPVLITTPDAKAFIIDTKRKKKEEMCVFTKDLVLALQRHMARIAEEGGHQERRDGRAQRAQRSKDNVTRWLEVGKPFPLKKGKRIFQDVHIEVNREAPTDGHNPSGLLLYVHIAEKASHSLPEIEGKLPKDSTIEPAKKEKEEDII